ncbi:hypothetical protein Goari_016386 [Gossypium aridum]|uniref:Uncharacterized protein n=1 Tax=Gossypium aridum TaxID=34290 RepID=A0A7J8WID8_GOSAI|nr:hypothetical protein [Gossypium aridum]
MASRKQQHTTEALINFNVNRFIILEVERLYLQISDRSFIQEHGFDPTMSAYNKIWDLVLHYYCNNFCATPIELAIDAIVYEFYATLKDQKNRRQQGALKFNTTIIFPMAKMWMQSICTRLAPTHNASDVTALVNFQMEIMFDARHRLYSESPCAKNGWTTPTPLPDMLMRFLPSGEEEDNE